MASKNGIGSKFFIVTSVLTINSLGVLYFARDNFELPQFLNIAFEFVEAKLYDKSDHKSLLRRTPHSPTDVSQAQRGLEIETYCEVKSKLSKTRQVKAKLGNAKRIKTKLN